MEGVEPVGFGRVGLFKAHGAVAAQVADLFRRHVLLQLPPVDVADQAVCLVKARPAPQHIAQGLGRQQRERHRLRDHAALEIGDIASEPGQEGLQIGAAAGLRAHHAGGIGKGAVQVGAGQLHPRHHHEIIGPRLCLHHDAIQVRSAPPRHRHRRHEVEHQRDWLVQHMIHPVGVDERLPHGVIGRSQFQALGIGQQGKAAIALDRGIEREAPARGCHDIDLQLGQAVRIQGGHLRHPTGQLFGKDRNIGDAHRGQLVGFGAAESHVHGAHVLGQFQRNRGKKIRQFQPVKEGQRLHLSVSGARVSCPGSGRVSPQPASSRSASAISAAVSMSTDLPAGMA